MSRLKISVALSLLALSCAAERTAAPSPRADAAVWDESPADRSDYYPAGPLIWPARIAAAAFPSRTSDEAGDARRRSLDKNAATDAPAGSDTTDLRSSRPRREAAAAEPSVVEKPQGSREARLLSPPEGWPEQSLAVQFRRRPEIGDRMPAGNYEEADEREGPANLPPLIRAHYAPKTDFVTSGRGRGGAEGLRHPAQLEGRESRDLPIARSYEEYELPIFRNVVREHDFDVQIPRNYYYPNRYRSQRDYYYRGDGGGGGPAMNPYVYDRYRDEEEDYELYGRYRTTPKPKRIIYYATLPEIVRKPVDLRNYQRPYESLPARGPEAQLEADRNRIAPNSVEAARRPLRYPYDNYDNYVKRSSYYARRMPPYAAGEKEHPKEQERHRASYRDKMRSDDRKLENQFVRSGDDRRLPWTMQVGAEVNVKDNERIPGRNIFGQMADYERYEGSRVKKTSGNAERKEDVRDEKSSGSSTGDNDSSIH